MSDSVVTSRPSSKPAWKILAVIVVFTTMIAAFFYWATSLNETEQMLVGDWVIDSKDSLFVAKDNTYRYFRFSPDGAFDVFYLEDGETSPSEPFGYWSANRRTIKVKLGERKMLKFLRNGSGNSLPIEMSILKLTDTELILEKEGALKRLEK